MATPPEPAGSQSQHERIYAAARYYDIAFAYRDFAEECDFLIRAAALHLGRDPSSVLELAAGPANHAIELARRFGTGAVAVLLSYHIGRVAPYVEQIAHAGMIGLATSNAGPAVAP